MRRLALAPLVALLLVSCHLQGEDGSDGKDGASGSSAPANNTYMVNSSWSSVRSAYLAPGDSLDGWTYERDNYNSGRLDDLWRIYQGTLPAIDSAPDCPLSIIRPKDNYLLKSQIVKRSSVATLIPTWRELATSLGGTLYVDRTPPAYHFALPSSPGNPLPTDPYYLYAWYLIYLSDGAIYAERRIDTQNGLYLMLDYAREEIATFNAAHPDDPLGLIWSQKYTAPDGVKAR